MYFLVFTTDRATNSFAKMSKYNLNRIECEKNHSCSNNFVQNSFATQCGVVARAGEIVLENCRKIFFLSENFCQEMQNLKLTASNVAHFFAADLGL